MILRKLRYIGLLFVILFIFAITVHISVYASPNSVIELTAEETELSDVYQILFQVTLVFMLMITVTLYWMRVLRLENKERLITQENLNQTLEQLEDLYNSSLALSSTLSLNEVLELVISKLRSVIPFEYATVQVAREDSYEIIYTVGFSENEDLMGYRFTFDDQPLISQVILGKKPFVIDDNKFYFEPYGLSKSSIRSRLLLPLIFDDEVVGILTLDHSSPKYFTSDFVRWGTAFAIQVAIALNNAKMFEALKIARDAAEEILNQVKQHQLDGYLIKPITQSMLLDTLMNCLGIELRLEEEQKAKCIVQSQVDGVENLKGANILLVEDNEINQLVAKDLLETEGLRVTCANNGLEAVDIIAADDSLDLVLMDLQMPILDGYKATDLIRGFGEPMCGIPIIAMTADAMDGTREQVVARGFNDYVTKPIAPLELFGVLVKYISTNGVKLGMAANDSSKVAGHQKAQGSIALSREYQMEAIDTEDGLMRVTGNEDLYRRILMKFYENNETLKNEVKDLIAKSDYEMARRMVHTVKGVSGNIGAKSLQSAAEQFEYAIRDKDMLNLDTAANTFLAELQRVLDDIRPYAKEDNGEPKVKSSKDEMQVGNNDELREHIIQLMPSVVMGDVKSCRLTAEKISCKKWSSEFDAEIEGLLSALTKYKYEKAESIALTLMDKLSS